MENEKICLIIPCYNEEKRLKIHEFNRFQSLFFLFVNDGSTDNTINVLEKNEGGNKLVLNLKKNVGKAEAVRRGMLYLRTHPIFEQIRWVGFWDADLATPLDEIRNFIVYYETFYNTADCIWGIRVKRLGSHISRSGLRHLYGRLFASISSTLLNLECYDSQCGAKLFKKELIEIAFREKFISRWIFDVEILLRLKNYNIVEYALGAWEDVDGSKIRFFPVMYRTIIELFKIKGLYCEKFKGTGAIRKYLDK